VEAATTTVAAEPQSSAAPAAADAGAVAQSPADAPAATEAVSAEKSSTEDDSEEAKRVAAGAAATSAVTPGTNTPAATSSAGITVSTVNLPTPQANGLVNVVVPQAAARTSAGLIIALPKEVTAQTQEVSTNVKMTLTNDQPLPTWIRYDTKLNALVTDAVPQTTFPLTVVLTVGNQRTVIRVSE
jgi:hypothetical protein